MKAKKTKRFDQALQLATEAHSGQYRKGTTQPYITHPVAVAALVAYYGGTEDQQIAALLHDVLEDAGPEWAPTIEQAFGPDVLSMVQFCTDGVPDKTGIKPPWVERKQAYLQHLKQSNGPALLVSACDKLHNLQSIHQDLIDVGEAVWERFTAKKEGSLWYYRELVSALIVRVDSRLAGALQDHLMGIEALS